MFVDIENYKSPLKVENMLTPYSKGLVVNGVRQPKEKITPQVCFEVLRSTNAPRNIKNMLQCIADLPPSEQAQFKDVVLSTFDNREQPNTQPHNIVLLGRKLAQASGYEKELVEVHKIKEGEFLLSASQLNKIFISFKNSFFDDDFSAYNKVIFLSSEKITFDIGVKFPKHLEFPNSSDVFFDGDIVLSARCGGFKNVQSMLFKDGAKVDLSGGAFLPENLDLSRCSNVNLSGCDLCKQSNLRFKDGAIVNLSRVQNLPTNLDLSHCSEVNLSDCDLSNRPNFDFSWCDSVDLSKCDLSNQPNLSFKDEAIVNLSYVENLPSNLDLSRCSNVNLSGCDLCKQSNLRFKDGAKIGLGWVKNLLVDIDFSKYDGVDLSGWDLGKVTKLAFKDGAEVNLSSAQNLPPNLDFSHCSDVKLSYCNLSNQPNLSFKDGAIVDLSGARNLPPHLDFSLCSEVDLSFCDLSGQPNLRFKDGAIVCLSNIWDFPPQLDFSRCDKVNLEYCKFSSVKMLVFKNREQEIKSKCYTSSDWKGKIIYADEQAEASLNLAMMQNSKGGR